MKAILIVLISLISTCGYAQTGTEAIVFYHNGESDKIIQSAIISTKKFNLIKPYLRSYKLNSKWEWYLVNELDLHLVGQHLMNALDTLLSNDSCFIKREETLGYKITLLRNKKEINFFIGSYRHTKNTLAGVVDLLRSKNAPAALIARMEDILKDIRLRADWEEHPENR